MSDFLPEMIVGALINAVCTTAVVLASRRRITAGVLLGLAVLIAYLAVLLFWPGPPSSHLSWELLATYLATVAVIWCPGAIMAIAASLRGDRALGVGSVVAGSLLGGGYIFIGLAFACGMLGDCL